MHNTFRLPPTQSKGPVCPLEDGPMNTLRSKLGGVQLFIIDEISMVSVKQLYDIDARLRQVYATTQDFGGKSLIVVGHLRQLPPVAGRLVFKDLDDRPIGAVVGNYLWANFKLYELTEIMRQKGELEFCKALNNMAEGIMDEDDIALIRAQQIYETRKPPDEAIHLFKTNAECLKYNLEIHRKLGTDGCMSTASDNIQGRKSNLTMHE